MSAVSEPSRARTKFNLGRIEFALMAVPMSVKTLMSILDKLPDDARLYGWGQDYCNGVHFMVVDSEEFPENEEGGVLPRMTVELRLTKPAAHDVEVVRLSFEPPTT